MRQNLHQFSTVFSRPLENCQQHSRLSLLTAIIQDGAKQSATCISYFNIYTVCIACGKLMQLSSNNSHDRA